jgi:hypothetical protein
LRLRKEIERLTEAVAEMSSEQEVRDTVGNLNRRILEWRRFSEGPPIYVRLVSKEEMLDRWRSAQAAQAAKRARPARLAADPVPQTSRGRRGWRWWRRARGTGA